MIAGAAAAAAGWQPGLDELPGCLCALMAWYRAGALRGLTDHGAGECQPPVLAGRRRGPERAARHAADRLADLARLLDDSQIVLRGADLVHHLPGRVDVRVVFLQHRLGPASRVAVLTFGDLLRFGDVRLALALQLDQLRINR